MNPRRMVVEDRALALADDLAAEGHAYLSARLRGTVPETFGLGDEHVPLLREALAAVPDAAPAHAGAVARVLAALDDLPGHIGRRDRVFVTKLRGGAYMAHWEGEDWLEQGPQDASLATALAWAAARSDDVRLNDGA